ncbi:hypothetical protein D3C71_1842210 [compost metagenome]
MQTEIVKCARANKCHAGAGFDVAIGIGKIDGIDKKRIARLDCRCGATSRCETVFSHITIDMADGRTNDELLASKRDGR